MPKQNRLKVYKFVSHYMIKKKQVNLNPPTVLALVFLIAMLVGTLLLKMPFAHYGELSWVQSAFTAMSAITITGLSVVNIGATFTLSGQLIILALIQLGGVGFMTFAIIAVLSFSDKLELKQQFMAQDGVNKTDLAKVNFIARGVFIYSLVFEIFGFLILTLAWHDYYSWSDSAYFALFYSISAFNNAGFTIFNGNFANMYFSPIIFVSISLLYMIGGLGFLVLMDIKKNKKWRKLSVNSKIILSAVLILNVISFLLIWILEANNTHTLQNMPITDQAMHAWFQATVTRSSGFNSIDIAQMTPASSFLMMLLMFIGGGSLSTAGGIKIGTFVVLILSTITFLTRQEEVKIFKYSIAQITVIKALAVTMITCVFIFVGMFILLILEPEIHFVDLLFEVVSAVCTVGLSRGITTDLSDLSLLLLMLLMFIGRLGPLTLAYLIATPKSSRLKHPETDIQIG